MIQKFTNYAGAWFRSKKSAKIITRNYLNNYKFTFMK